MFIEKYETVERDRAKNIKLFIYGKPTLGKTYMAGTFPKPLFLNTDGNFKALNHPVKNITQGITVKNKAGTDVTLTGWQYFKGIVNELASMPDITKTYKTIVVDLIEDIYLACTTHNLKELGISHESELGFGKAYTMVRNDFLSVMKTLTTLENVNVVIIGHEKETQKKDKYDRDYDYVKCDLPDKVANKIDGMVDITARAQIQTKDKIEDGIVVGQHTRRWLDLQSSPNQQSGNRYSLEVKGCMLEYDSLIQTIKAALPTSTKK